MVPGWNSYDNNSNSNDVAGHGTAVAGTAAAAGNNAAGVASVAWGCKVMPIRVSDTSGNATYSSIASGLNWAASHGARVANISYIVTGSSTVTAAARSFQTNGGVVVASAGNYSSFDSSPDNPSILTVSATNQATCWNHIPIRATTLTSRLPAPPLLHCEAEAMTLSEARHTLLPSSQE